MPWADHGGLVALPHSDARGDLGIVFGGLWVWGKERSMAARRG